MFERRLTAFWVLLTLLSLVIVGRLAQIQIAGAAYYEAQAERLLARDPVYVSAPRGRILDCNGRPLLTDEPTSNVCIHYRAMTDRADVRERYLRSEALALRERGEFPDTMPLDDITAVLRMELAAIWPRIALLLDMPVPEVRARAAEVCARVDRMREYLQKFSPIPAVREESLLLPVIEGIPDDAALAIRLELEKRPWLRVLPATRRVVHDADSLVHVLGRLGQATAERIAEDPLADDELRDLRPTDRCGISGVERLGETVLRGWRGRILESRDGTLIERVDPRPGHDVFLTIDLDVQRQVYDLLAKGVKTSPNASGGAAVVIDVESRGILALVSYPAYEFDGFDEAYADLRDDTRNLPLLFRAVQAEYPPGSICKAITLVGGLSEGVVTPHTRFHCTGHLLPDKPNIFRCWINTQYGATHDAREPEGQDAVSGVRNSCNIYFFKVGGLLGPERLCAWFDKFGLGRAAGTGLIEESVGVNPTADWLRDPARQDAREYRTSDAWNFAIGQGEVTVTPLQAANVAASVAAGYWTPVRLAYGESGRALGEPVAPEQRFEERHLRVLRQGMYEVVNDPFGTAPRAKLDRTDYVLCGKTGSAQAVPRVVNRRYVFEWPDQRRASVIALSAEDARRQIGDDAAKLVGHRAHQRFPGLEEGDRLPSHAWFVGYTQTAETPPGAGPRGRTFAISVIVEYGGSGGRIAGPVAKEIGTYLVERYVDGVDGPAGQTADNLR